MANPDRPLFPPADATQPEAEQFSPIVKLVSDVTAGEMKEIAERTGGTHASNFPTVPTLNIVTFPNEIQRFFLALDVNSQTALGKRILQAFPNHLRHLATTAMVIRKNGVELVKSNLSASGETVSTLTFSKPTYSNQTPRYIQDKPVDYPGFDEYTKGAIALAQQSRIKHTL